MNEFTQPVGQEELDRMVDGELTEEQQQSFLARLEDSPVEWKRLALAYAEAQVWKSSFRETVSTADVRPAPVSSEVAPTPRSQSVLSRVVFATVLLACGFGLGAVVNQPAGSAGTIADSMTDEDDSAVSGGSEDTAPSDSELAAHDASSDADQAVNPSIVQFVVHDGRSDTAQMVNVPFHDESVPLDEVFSANEPTVPDHIRELLQQTGIEIEEEQGVWPLALPDGRQVVFPVNQVRIRNGGRIYQ